MSDEKTEKKLTVNDPVDAETLLRIGELTGANRILKQMQDGLI